MVILPFLAFLACGDKSHANNGGKGGASAKGGAGGSSAGAGGKGGAGGTAGSTGVGGSAGVGGGAGAAGSGGSGGAGGTAGAGGTSGSGGGTGGGGGGNAGAAGRGGAGGGTAGSGSGTAGTAGGAGGAGGGTAGSGGATSTGGSGGATGTGGGGGSGAAGTAGGAGGAGGGTAGSTSSGGSGGSAGAGGGSCALPPTDAGTPATLPDNVVFVPNVTVSTLAGGGTPGTANGAFGVGQLDNPVSIAIEASGSLAVSDFDNDRLRRVVATDGTLSTLTMQSGFTRPYGLAVAGGVLYADTDNSPTGAHSGTSGTIWRIDGTSGVATAVGVNLGRPRGLAALSDGRLALADYQNQRVRIFDPTTGNVSDLAGTMGCPGTANGTGPDARFVFPYGVAVLAGDRIIVADHDAHVLREVSLAGVVTTFAGDTVAGTIDGPRASARFSGPKALAADSNGAVFVSDDVAHYIRRIAADGTVTTVAGDGTGGFMDGAGNVAQFFGQEGIAVSANGATIYVADGTGGSEPPGPYHRIRKIVIAP